MARFIIFHTGPQDVSQDTVVEAARALRTALPAEVEWLNSWFVPGQNQLVCEWEASDEQTLQSALKDVIELFTIEVVHEVVHVDPKWYK